MMVQKWDAEKYSKGASFVSELGLPLVELLAPCAGEHILDLGCGDGTLALNIEGAGATVTGVDSSREMVSSAQRKGIQAIYRNAEELDFSDRFDAVFSNAALHWMTDYKAVLAGVKNALKNRGRFVGEFGGHGNIRSITEAIEAVYSANPEFGRYESPLFFPSDKEYKFLLEENGFDVEYIELINRPTPLSTGIREWLKLFAEHAISKMDESSEISFLDQVEQLVKPRLFSESDGWVADYVRLRFLAVKGL